MGKIILSLGCSNKTDSRGRLWERTDAMRSCSCGAEGKALLKKLNIAFSETEHLPSNALLTAGPGAKLADLKGRIENGLDVLVIAPEKSELRIRPDKPWNTAAAAGRMLILHQTRKGSFENREGYHVKNAELLADGTVKVALRGPAPFIIGYHQAFFVDGKLKVNRPIQKFDGLNYYPGIQVTFPRIGRTFTVRNTSLNSMETDTDLQKAGVRDGDWFYFHAVAPGQKVSIPRFTSRSFAE